MYKTYCIDVSLSLIFKTNRSKLKKTLGITIFMELRNTAKNQANLVRLAYVKIFQFSVLIISWSCHLKNLFNDVWTYYTANIKFEETVKFRKLLFKGVLISRGAKWRKYGILQRIPFSYQTISKTVACFTLYSSLSIFELRFLSIR